MKPEPQHLFATVDEMLSPAGLGVVLGQRVEAVERSRMDVAHLSGNHLERVRALHGATASSLVLKTFDPERDWIMRLTHDSEVREVALFRHGIYARLPPGCYAPAVAAARHGGAWASLMLDVSEALEHGSRAVLPLPVHEQYVRHLAKLHTAFLGDRSLRDPALGLSSIADFVAILAPSTVRVELAGGRGHPVLEAAARGWEVFEQIAPPAAARILGALQHDPRPLLDLLAGAPQTLLHGDYKPDNLGRLAPSNSGAAAPRTVMLDWQDAALGPPLLDLGYFVAITAARLPMAKDEVFELYHEARGSVTAPRDRERDMEIGLLAGGALRLLWQPALGTLAPDATARDRARHELEWWCEKVVRAGRWLA